MSDKEDGWGVLKNVKVGAMNAASHSPNALANLNFFRSAGVMVSQWS